MNEIELWESEIEDSNKSHVFENMCGIIDTLSESIDIDLRLIDEGILTEAVLTEGVIDTVKRKIKELLKKFRVFIRKLLAKTRAFIQKKIRKPEDKIFDSLCNRISKINTADYIGNEEFNEHARKFNDYLEKILSNFSYKSPSNTDTYLFYFLSPNNRVYTGLNNLSNRIRDVKQNYDNDINNNRFVGSASVDLGSSDYLNDKSYVGKLSLWSDSNIDLGDLWIVNDVPDIRICNIMKDVLNKSEETVNEAYKILDFIDGKFIGDIEKFSDVVSKSDMQDETNLAAYKLAVKNITTSINNTRVAITEILDKALSQDTTIVKIRHEFISIYNKLI